MVKDRRDRDNVGGLERISPLPNDRLQIESFPPRSKTDKNIRYTICIQSKWNKGGEY